MTTMSVADTADSADDMPSAKAIAKGLAAGHTAEKPGYWLHVCGTGMLQWVRKIAFALSGSEKRSFPVARLLF